MQTVEAFEDSVNSNVYNKLRRIEIHDLTGRCTICKPHRGENRVKENRDWKRNCKVRKQYMKNAA